MQLKGLDNSIRPLSVLSFYDFFSLVPEAESLLSSDLGKKKGGAGQGREAGHREGWCSTGKSEVTMNLLIHKLFIHFPAHIT